MATLASAGQPDAPPDRPRRSAATPPLAARTASGLDVLRGPEPTAALATSASSMVTTRMTSTPSRRIVTSDAKNAGPNAPAGRASSPLDQRLDVCRQGLDPRRQFFPLEARRQIAAQRVELDFQRPDRLRTAPEEVSLQRLEVGHVDRGQLGGGFVRLVVLGLLERRDGARALSDCEQRSRITGRPGRGETLRSKLGSSYRADWPASASIRDRSVTPLALSSRRDRQSGREAACGRARP